MEDCVEIKISDITAPKLREDEKISSAQWVKTLHDFGPDDFESFILEWLKFCRYKDAEDVHFFKMGGTGDEGIDVFISFKNSFEAVQCKRYKEKLTFPAVRQIVTKILWYRFKNGGTHPNKIFISSIEGLNSEAVNNFTNKTIFKKSILSNMKDDLSSLKISYKTNQLTSFKKYLSSFDFDHVEATNIVDVVAEYFSSDMASFRFSNKRIKLTRREPKDVKVNDKRYVENIKGLLIGEDTDFVNGLIEDANEAYYSALSLEETCEYLFGDTKEFDKIKDDVRTSVNNALICKYQDERTKYSKVIERAMDTSVDDSYLFYELHIVKNNDKCGACHILTNEGKIKWQ